MKLRFRIKPRGEAPKSITVSVPFAKMVAVSGTGGLQPLDIAPEFIAAFEARHNAEVLEIRRPARRARA
jgi:hypothetical protein